MSNSVDLAQMIRWCVTLVPWQPYSLLCTPNPYRPPSIHVDLLTLLPSIHLHLLTPTHPSIHLLILQTPSIHLLTPTDRITCAVSLGGEEVIM